MKKLLLLLLLAASVLSPAASAQTTTTLTGAVRDLSNAAVTSGQVSFTLQPGIDTAMSGTARFTPSEIDCTITGAGAVKALDGVSTCTVVNNTAISQPSGTSYKVCIQPQFIQPGSCFVWYATGGSVDITQQVPTPPLTPAYNLVDTFSNQTVGGNKTFSGTVTYAGTIVMGSVTASGLLSGLGIVDTGDLTMQQPNVATSGVNQSSNNFKIQGNYWNGSASAVDQWLLQDILGAGTNPTSTLTLTHSGSSGAVNVSLPNASISGLVSAYTSAGELIGKYSTIGAALAAAGSGGKVEVGCGTYTENLLINFSVTLNGVNKGGNCVVINPSTLLNPTIDINATAAPLGSNDRVTVSNLSIVCPGSSVCGDGIRITGSQVTNQPNDHIVLQDVLVGLLYTNNTAGATGFSNGIEITGRTIYTTLDRIISNSNRNDGLRVVNSGGVVGPPTMISFRDSHFQGNFNYGVEWDSGGSVTLGETDTFDHTSIEQNGWNHSLSPCAGILIKNVWGLNLENGHFENNCNGSLDANAAHIRITGAVALAVNVLNNTFEMTTGAAPYGYFNDAVSAGGDVSGNRFGGAGAVAINKMFHTAIGAGGVTQSNIHLGYNYNLNKPDIVVNAFNDSGVSAPVYGISNCVVANNAAYPLSGNTLDLISLFAFPVNCIDVVSGPATINTITSGSVGQTLRVCSGGGAITLAHAAGGNGQFSFDDGTNRVLQSNRCVMLRHILAADQWNEVAGLGDALLNRANIWTQPQTINSLSVNGGAALNGETGGAANSKVVTSVTSSPYVGVASDFTTAANTSLQAITGLTWAFPATAGNYNFSCNILYQQNTAAASVFFGIQAVTNNPTNIAAIGHMSTAANGSAADATLPTLATTTATTIVNGSPSAAATVFLAILAGRIELGASANTINIMTATSVAGDSVTIKRGSGCNLY